MDMRQIKAIEKASKERILKICPEATEESGIYIFKREENGFKYAYVGQAKHLLTRISQHLTGYQHIDLSIKKHKLYSDENPNGWKVGVLKASETELDRLEKEYILKYANAGYQMRNITTGGQGEGKASLNPNKSSKGYYDGIERGKILSSQMVGDWFKKHLVVKTKSEPPTKNQQKALEKFENFIKPSKTD